MGRQLNDSQVFDPVLSTIASSTMVGSRWVTGCSTGMRPFSAIASGDEGDQSHAQGHAQADRREAVEVATEEALFGGERATVNTIMIIAGSASVANIACGSNRYRQSSCRRPYLPVKGRSGRCREGL